MAKKILDQTYTELVETLSKRTSYNAADSPSKSHWMDEKKQAPENPPETCFATFDLQLLAFPIPYK
ncbi:MAG: hypothetical protein JETCAE01_02000 [Anaerolineaceae bacterium]|nr:MAG: hypothetical protein JETCAE01_02000 [Anaerolineaceae bacterium]